MAAILYTNLADGDDATLTVSSAIASAQPENLQNPHTTRRWQGTLGENEYILIVFNSTVLVDTVGVFKMAGLTGSSELTDLDATVATRIRVCSSDVTGNSGDIFDSGNVTGQISYASLVKLLPAANLTKAIKIDIMAPGFSSIGAGRLVVGARNTFSRNFTYGWSFGFNDLSRMNKSIGGQTFVELDDRYRVLSTTFNCVSSTDRLSFVQEIDRLNGISTDVLFITDENSTNLGRDCVWGLIKDMSPPTQPYFDHFSKSYNVEERL